MRRQIDVSIVVLAYDFHYFDKCLESVSKQNIKKYEFIIITDDECSVCELLRKHWSGKDISNYIKIIFLSKTNAGSARNIGLDASTGKYIIFIDDDDRYFDNNSIKELSYSAEMHHSNICCGRLVGMDKYDKLFKINYKNDLDLIGIADFRKYQWYGGFQRCLFNRSFLIKNNIKFPELLRFQDAVFMVEACIKSECVLFIDRVVYCYRKGHKQTSWTKEKAIDHLKAVNILLDISKKFKLEKLHYLMVNNVVRMASVFSEIGMRSLGLVFLYQLMEAVEKIDIKLLRLHSGNMYVLFKPLYFIYVIYLLMRKK